MALGVNRGEFLQRPPTSKSLHRSFSSTERLVRILRPIVETATGLMVGAAADRRHRGAIGGQSVRHDFARAAVFLQDPLQEL